jgi:hypothetical protein
MKRAARMLDRVSVNHAPSGTLVKAEDRYRPSRHAIVSHGKMTRMGLILHTIRAASDTMQVSKNVTNITQTLVIVSCDDQN